MALLLVATAGAPNANSYATVDDAHAYHEGHYYADVWNGPTITDTKRSQVLVMATRLLDEHVDWFGVPTSSTQALRWPRSGIVDGDGRYVDGNAIPQAIKSATAELGRLLLASDLTTASGSSGDIEEIKVGPIGIKYAGAHSIEADTIPDSVWFMVRHVGTVRTRSRGGAIPLYRV